MQQRTFGKRNAIRPTSGSINPPSSALPQTGLSSVQTWLLAGAAFLGATGVGAFMLMGSAPPTPTPTVSIPEDMIWVTSQRLARHSCPSVACGIVGEFYYREGVQPLETRDGWVRVSKYYYASCTNGQSDYVDSGNAQCSQINGIVDGQFAEWVEGLRPFGGTTSGPRRGRDGSRKINWGL